MIAAKERERADDSRFASNLVYSRSADPPQQQQQGQTMPMPNMALPNGKQTVVSSPNQPKENRRTRPEAINVHWRPISIQPSVTLSRLTRARSRHCSHESSWMETPSGR